MLTPPTINANSAKAEPMALHHTPKCILKILINFILTKIKSKGDAG